MRYFLFFLVTYLAASIIVEQKIFEEARKKFNKVSKVEIKSLSKILSLILL